MSNRECAFVCVSKRKGLNREQGGVSIQTVKYSDFGVKCLQYIANCT